MFLQEPPKVSPRDAPQAPSNALPPDQGVPQVAIPVSEVVQVKPGFECLRGTNGVAVVQHVEKAEAVLQAFGIDFEGNNRYKVSMLPKDAAVKKDKPDKNAWNPTMSDLDRLHDDMLLIEETDCFSRFLFTALGCGRSRPATLQFAVNGKGEAYTIERECHLGGAMCDPFVTELRASDGRCIGRVQENFDDYFNKLFAECCLCTYYHDIELPTENDEFLTKYQLRVNISCCGRVNNCCGASCFDDNMVFDIMDMNGDIVANIQKTAAGDCCRAMTNYSTYLISFPADSTVLERMLLITSLLQLDYAYFDDQGGDG